MHEAITAAELLQNQTGLKVGVIDLYRPKPLPINNLISLLGAAERIVTLEEGLLGGGLGQLIGTFLLENKIFRPFYRIGIDDHFCFESGEREWMRDQYGLNANQIVKKVSVWLANKD